MSDQNKTRQTQASYRTPLSRRHFLRGAAAGWVFMNSAPAMALDSLLKQKSVAHKKLVWVFLRGALDALHTVVPIGDPNLDTHRGSFLSPIKEQLLPLSKAYALHPKLSFMHQLYKQKQMTAVVAVASGYRDRSHFDGQDQMESGLNVTDYDNGWLARAFNQIQGQGIAISRSVPIALRSAGKRAETWYPSSFPEASEDLLSRLADLYENDPALSTNLHALIKQKENPNMQMQEKARAKFPYLAKTCGELLANNKDMQCAMLELGGWDTHNNQAWRLSKLFSEFDEGMQEMHAALGDSWQDTLVVVSTEFGRTVAVNGTQGTDHGTGAAMFFAGGALAHFPTTIDKVNERLSMQTISGGQVLGNWPGLALNQLYEARDLMPTSDIRDWLGKALQQHWGLSMQQVSNIFPDIPV